MTHRYLPSAKKGGISNRAGLAMMTVILLLAFALGANGLNADVIWLDELYSISNMGGFDPPYSPAQIIDSLVTYSPDQVPLYYLLGAGWASVTGWSQVSLRYFALLTGVLMIAWLYRFAADAVNRRTAIVAALLMSTTAFVILYFHEIRMYTLWMCLGIAHSWLYWRLAHGFRATRLRWLLFTLTAVALLYTHNFSIILFVGLGVYHLLFVSKSRRWLNIIFAWGLGAALFLPYVPSVVGGLSYAGSISARSAPRIGLVEDFAQLLVNGLEILWLPLILLFGYALLCRRPRAILGLLVITLAIIGMLLLVSWRFNWFSLNRMRYFLIVWAPVVILLAWGLTSMPRWFAITILFILPWCIAGYQYGQSTEILKYTGWINRARKFSPLHEYVYHLKDKPRSGDYLVGFSDSSEQVNKVRNQSGSTADYYLKLQLGIDGVFLESHLMRYRLEHDMRKALNDYAYILFAYNPADTPRNAVTALDIIREEFIPCSALVNEPDLLVQRYVHPILDCGREEYRSIHYDNGVRVVDRFARYVPGAKVLQILTGWEVADESLLDKYNVSMQIIASAWRNVRQEDRHLYEMPPWDVIELSTAGLPPGDYRLVMILYHRDGGEKVSAADPTTGETAKILPLLSFTIEPDS